MNNFQKKRLSRKLSSLAQWFSRHVVFLIQIVVFVIIFYFLFGLFVVIFEWLFKMSMSLSDFILLITAALVFIYTYETNKMKHEITIQNDIEQAPIMVLYIRKVSDLGLNIVALQKLRDERYPISHLVGEGIVPSDYILRLRNVGKGVAFNVRIVSKNFEVDKYEERFFTPMKDEHAIKIYKKSLDDTGGLMKNRDLKELDNAILSIYCESLSGKEYYFDYKIVSVEDKKVEFTGKEEI